MRVADPEGFEPSIPAKVYSLSRGALSTTQPKVQWFVELRGYEQVRGFSSMGVSRRIEELLLFGFGAIVLP
jgi:hypothetical protein